jgi:hypothetical protein
MVLLERLALDRVLADEHAAEVVREDLRRRARVAVAELVRPDVHALVRADGDRLRLPGLADLCEDGDVERVAGCRGGWCRDQHEQRDGKAETNHARIVAKG